MRFSARWRIFTVEYKMEEDFFAESSFFVGEKDISKRILLRPRPAARARCAYLCLFFALSQRIGEEKTPKGLMPFGFPQDFLLLLSFGGYQKALWHLQFLRQRIKDPPPIASRLSFFASLCAALQSK